MVVLAARFEFDINILVEFDGVVVRVVFQVRRIVEVLGLVQKVGFVVVDFDGELALGLVQKGREPVGVVDAVEFDALLGCHSDLKCYTFSPYAVCVLSHVSTLLCAQTHRPSRGSGRSFGFRAAVGNARLEKKSKIKLRLHRKSDVKLPTM